MANNGPLVAVHFDGLPTRTKPPTRRTLRVGCSSDASLSGIAWVRCPCDRFTQEDAGRNSSVVTIRKVPSAAICGPWAEFARHFGKSPDKLGPDDLRSYQAYLLQERKLTVGTVIARVAALRFCFVRALKRHEFRQDLPYPKKQRRFPNVLSVEAGNLAQRALLMILYGTGMRRREVSLLKISDIDSCRMMIRVERGKGGHDRDLPLARPSWKHCASIGVGRSRRFTCFQAANGTAA
ncbi:MAG TPA: tyrosine-type recombinase/integrase [Bryobacteraceae bacterium]|nr:tyrosine-type recombinase/integrase [Bryobacteraceae bacterium]